MKSKSVGKKIVGEWKKTKDRHSNELNFETVATRYGSKVFSSSSASEDIVHGKGGDKCCCCCCSCSSSGGSASESDVAKKSY